MKFFVSISLNLLQHNPPLGEICLVVPCFNEAQRLSLENFDELLRTGWIHLLAVDDGSTDGTGEILDEFAQTRSNISVVHLERNSGKGEAVRRGCIEAYSPRLTHVGYIDADFATPPQEIIRVAKIAQSNLARTIVMGSRVRTLGSDIQRSTSRHIFGRLFATLASILIQEPIYDTQCGLKLIKSSSDFHTYFATRFLSRWLFDIEIILRLKQQQGLSGKNQLDGHVLEVPLLVWHEVGGSKTRARDGLIALGQLLQLSLQYRWDKYSSSRTNNHR